ncbi:ERF family protein [Amycolatopsis dendrobii]|uniref:ERF family protein n=1 Tax=Amycolatopsis dendrobii TaxID=2760662 RepID=A0A7W3ZA26_9PSEU|nr:ERF family protein [Amycolatopsis dendrobii]MBB1153462.1 ERF family protein [Amycolatopsis dendrobii]
MNNPVTTEQTSTVVRALADVMAQVRSVSKGDWNDQQRFNFRGIDAVMNAVGPALRDCGVAIVPFGVEVRYRDITSAHGKPMRECTVLVTYRVYGPGGDHLDIQAPGESLDVGDKGTAKAMSVAMRTALIQALCLPTSERDPDHDSYERGEAKSGTVLDQIRAYATEQGFDLHAVMTDFQTRMGEEIQAASDHHLRIYLDDLKKFGLSHEPERDPA